MTIDGGTVGGEIIKKLIDNCLKDKIICPFCGGEELEGWANEDGYWVICTNCRNTLEYQEKDK